MDVACSTYGGEERRIQDFGGKPEGKRPLGRPRRRLQDNYVFYCYVYVFLLLSMFSSLYSVSLCCCVYFLCVNVYCNTATGCQLNCS